MTHPYRLHATAATWSLHNARQALAARAIEEAAAIGAEQTEAADGIQAWRPMVGRGSGGHGDPSAGAVLAGYRAPRANRYAELAERTTTTLTWLADQLAAPPASDPLARLTGLRLMPGTAATLTRWLTEADDRIRSILYIGPDRERLGGVPCPACSARRLVVLTAAPDRALWTVVCETRCLCTGVGCGCGMRVQVEGVAHIWPRADVIAGVTPAAA